MTETGDGPRKTGTVRFEAGAAAAPINIRFGYRPDQLAGVYLPLVALALALMLIATIMSRAGYAPLAFSAILVGTMAWMGAPRSLRQMLHCAFCCLEVRWPTSQPCSRICGRPCSALPLVLHWEAGCAAGECAEHLARFSGPTRSFPSS